MKKTSYLLLTLLNLSSTNAFAQSHDLSEGISVNIEASGTVSSGDNAPLWLVSNKHGLTSTNANSAYERISLIRDINTDSLSNWRYGYGIDLQCLQHSQSLFFVHQAYAEMQWMKATLTLGAKERGVDLRNNNLTSGGLSKGINARPVPALLLDVDYFNIPFTDDWVKATGRVGYGITTDGRWQKEWIDNKNETLYTSNILYHEKSLYVKFGDEQRFPLTFTFGIQMMNQFGGTTYNLRDRNSVNIGEVKNPSGINAFWHALWPMGSSDGIDGQNTNAAGNTLGSYNGRIEWADDNWKLGLYAERFFEDHSMLTFQYGIYDHLLGIDAELPKNPFVSHLLLEHLSTKDQSGAVYHDGTVNIPDQLAGTDNYYNHSIYGSWQHWGMTMGSPLITSPIYNSNHTLTIKNNRVQAWHLGMDGKPCDNLSWRVLATFTRNWGTYPFPLDEIEDETHLLIETTYSPIWANGFSGTLSLGTSRGKLIGNTTGAQLTIRKRLKL